MYRAVTENFTIHTFYHVWIKKGTCHTTLQKKDIHQVSTCCTTCPITPQNKFSNCVLPCCTGLFKMIVGVQLSSCIPHQTRKQPPSDNSIRRWYAQFQETGCVCIPELKVRLRTAIEIITADMLRTVWNEPDYRVDVCRITKGAWIEHL